MVVQKKMVVVDRLVHKYDEILSSVHHGGHHASHHGPPVGEGHGGASPKIQKPGSGFTHACGASLSYRDNILTPGTNCKELTLKNEEGRHDRSFPFRWEIPKATPLTSVRPLPCVIGKALH